MLGQNSDISSTSEPMDETSRESEIKQEPIETDSGECAAESDFVHALRDQIMLGQTSVTKCKSELNDETSRESEIVQEPLETGSGECVAESSREESDFVNALRDQYNLHGISIESIHSMVFQNMDTGRADERGAKKSKPKGPPKKRRKGNEAKPMKSYIAVASCCKDTCYSKISAQEQRNLFDHFNSLTSKGLQDVFLSGLMSYRSPTTYRVNAKRKRDNVWRYCVRLENGDVEIVVCQKFLRGLYQCTEKRLRIIQLKTRSGQAFGERRGKHHNRPSSIDSDVWDLAKEHLSLLPATEGPEGSEGKRYFSDPTLNLKKVYDMFKEFYERATGKELDKPSYKTYHKFFKTELKYDFLQPMTFARKS